MSKESKKRVKRRGKMELNASTIYENPREKTENTGWGWYVLALVIIIILV